MFNSYIRIFVFDLYCNYYFSTKVLVADLIHGARGMGTVGIGFVIEASFSDARKLAAIVAGPSRRG